MLGLWLGLAGLYIRAHVCLLCGIVVFVGWTAAGASLVGTSSCIESTACSKVFSGSISTCVESSGDAELNVLCLLSGSISICVESTGDTGFKMICVFSGSFYAKNRPSLSEITPSTYEIRVYIFTYIYTHTYTQIPLCMVFGDLSDCIN